MPDVLTTREAEVYNLLRKMGPLSPKKIEDLVGYNNVTAPGKSASRIMCSIRKKGYPVKVAKMGWGKGGSKYSISDDVEPISKTPPIGNDDSPVSDFEIKKDNEKWTIITTKDFKTPEEAMAFAGMDPTIWICYKMDIVNNDWDITAKFGENETERFQTKTNKQIKVKFFFERKIPLAVEDGMEQFLSKRMTPPKFKKIIRKAPKDPHIFVLSMPDAHFGMLAWKEECGESYDTKIASRLFIEAGKTLLNRAAGYNIEKIIIPIGNDLFHMNDITGVTPKQKNRLDVDGRMAKVFNKVLESYIELISFCRDFAPVELIWVRGNHDPESSWYAAKVIEAWYTNATDVNVDTFPSPQKHLVYGKNLLAWTHGDEEPHNSLAGVMAGKWPEDWGNTLFREWHLGHTHKKKEMFTVIGDEMRAGVRIRVIPSLSAKDFWHTCKGYMSIRSAEGYLYSKSNGYSGHFAVNVIDNEIMNKNLKSPSCNR